MTNECSTGGCHNRYTSNLESTMRVIALRLLITSKFLADVIEKHDIDDDQLEVYYDYISTTISCFDENDMEGMELNDMINLLTKKIHEVRLAELIPLGGVQ